jgi:hypothetical protein
MHGPCDGTTCEERDISAGTRVAGGYRARGPERSPVRHDCRGLRRHRSDGGVRVGGTRTRTALALTWSRFRLDARGVSVQAATACLRTAVLRALLLGALAIGVLGMHTVGHASGHDRWVPFSVAVNGSHHASSGDVDVAADQQRGDTAHRCPPWSCAAAMPDLVVPGPGSGENNHDVGIVVMCLAVLGGIGLLALFAAVLVWRRYRVPPPRRLPGAGGVVWARPDRVSTLTLRLVTVAVLRT